ncbi:MAG: methionine synthase [candidate division Zixibacteria bacterium]|nr:methionine synthase [candidate division Zixibacteria bacterium]
MDRLLERLNNHEVLVSDGAMGTMLFERGVQSGDCPERVNLERPEILEEIAMLYFQAGADIIQTNTFGASPLKLAQYSLEDQTDQINIAAIQAVRKAIGDKAYLSASCGPCGKLLKPYGDTDTAEVLKGFERQMAALISEGIDMICIETMTDLNEAKLAIKAARSISSDIPMCATMTFDPTPRGFFTIMGVSIEQAAGELIEAGANIIGSNCGNGIENMVKIAAEFRRQTDQPLIIQSNAGLPKLQDDMVVYSESPEFMAGNCREMLKTGVNIVGGCCGTTPEHITAIRKIVDEFTH